MPNLQQVVEEIGSLCESAVIKYEDAPHIIEVLLPTICSYLNYWWPNGPSAKLMSDIKVLKAKVLKNVESVDSESGKKEASAQLALPGPAGANAENKFDG